MACEKCTDLCLEYEIHSPGDLRKAFAVAHDNIADDTIQEVSAKFFLADARAVAEGGPWPGDLLWYQFECRSCGERFNLSAETYHGRGGAWIQASNSPENKLKARIIGDVPPHPDDLIRKEERLKPRQIGFLLVVGLIAFALLFFAHLRS